MTSWKTRLLGLCFVAVGVWANNTSLFVPLDPTLKPKLLAHRGVHQIYTGTDRSTDSCHATPLAENTHSHIANTIPSMRAAFEYGADVVELDIHLTKDNVFAVFHDWTLECRTDGSGVTHTQTIDYLKSLDIGHNLSPDGVVFPFRDTSIAEMPSLDEVLAADLPGQLLINFKSNRTSDGPALASLLKEQDNLDAVFGVYGGDKPTQAAISATPNLRGYDKPSLKRCLKPYVLIGWTGYVPKSCRTTLLAIPSNIAPYVWGWPHRFTQRLAQHGTDVILMGPYDGSGFSTGIDSVEQLEQVPTGFDGYVWTDRIELIGPALAARNE